MKKRAVSLFQNLFIQIPFPGRKITISILFIVVFVQISNAQNVWIPDMAFTHALIEQGVDIDGDSLISYSEAEQITFLDISAIDSVFKDDGWVIWPQGKVSSLKGIEAFKNLDTLICAGNDLLKLILSGNPDLLYIDCSYNGTRMRASQSGDYYVIGGIREIDVSSCKNLAYLDCSRNRISNLDISGNPDLEILDCSENKLKSLDVSKNSGLSALYCDNNGLVNLNINVNPSLRKISCSFNQLIFLDVTENSHLTYLDCSYNLLYTLDVTNNPVLSELECSNNSLTNLKLFNNSALKILDCSSNQLADLDLDHNPALMGLSCASNQIMKLDVSNNHGLRSLSCSNNIIPNLNTRNNKELEELDCSLNPLLTIDVSNNTKLLSLNCGSNLLSYLDISENTRLTHLNAGGGKNHMNNTLRFLDLSNNTALIELDCSYNQLVNLDLSNNIYLSHLFCGNNQFNYLDISNNTGLVYLETMNMPTLSCMTVWEMPFPSTRILINSEGSDNVIFTTGSCSITGENKINPPPGFLIYPNPVTDYLTIESAEPAGCLVELISLNGRLIHQAFLQAPITQIDLSPVAKGMYIIRLRSSDSTISEKIIKL